jgi:hypothetical protein
VSFKIAREALDDLFGPRDPTDQKAVLSKDMEMGAM